MIMKKLMPVFATAIALCFASCSNHSMDVAKELNESYKHDGKTIELEGQLATSYMVWGSSDRETLDLHMTCGTALDNTKTETVSDIMVHYGTTPNSVIINVAPDVKQFKETDVVLYDKNGAKLTLADKVKVTGKVTYTAKGPKKEAGAAKIKMPEINKEKQGDGNDYRYTITDVTIEKI